MVIVYTSDELDRIFNDSIFLSEYETYKTENRIKLDNLQKFLDSLDINKKYHKISINKNKKYQSEETTVIKNINNLLNKTTSNNIDTIKKEILYSIDNAKHLLELIINSILDKCISQINYIDKCWYASTFIALISQLSDVTYFEGKIRSNAICPGGVRNNQSQDFIEKLEDFR